MNPVDTGMRGRITVSVTVGGTPVQVVAEACIPHPGIYAIPSVGSGVWIEFEEGDLDKPVWTGSWFPEGVLSASMGTVAPLQALPLIFQSIGLNHIVIGSTPADGIRLETAAGPSGPSIMINSTGIYLSTGQGASIVMAGKSIVFNQGALTIDFP